MINRCKQVTQFLVSKDILIPILIGILISVLSNSFNWDIHFQNLFWDSQLQEWVGKSHAIAQFLYNFGILPAILVPLLALFILILGYSFKALSAYRKIALYLFLVLAIGNGLIVNGLLKEHWGRPRPAQIIEYNGTQIFEPSLYFNSDSYGKSFPCGHATMGFYFFSIALLFKGRVRRSLFAFALLFGLAIGIARSSMGGHFLTDTVWSAILIWIVSKGIYLSLKLDKKPQYIELPAKTKSEKIRRKFIQIALVPLSFAFIFSVLLASPRDKTHTLILPELETAAIELTLELRGDVFIQSNSDRFSLETHAQGFGLPKTKLIANYRMDSETSISLNHKVLGYFSELNANTNLYLPSNKRYTIRIKEPYPKTIYLNSIEIDNFEDILVVE